jgi:hypothetical protein
MAPIGGMKRASCGNSETGSHRTDSTPIDPRQEPEAKGYWDRVLIDATRPWNWEPRDIWGSEGVNKGEALNFPPTSRPAQSTIDMINAKWDRYAIDPVKEFIGTPGGIMKNWWRDSN